jgi:hypothetical protein
MPSQSGTAAPQSQGLPFLRWPPCAAQSPWHRHGTDHRHGDERVLRVDGARRNAADYKVIMLSDGNAALTEKEHAGALAVPKTGKAQSRRSHLPR